MSEVETETEDVDTHGDTAEKKVRSDFFFFFLSVFPALLHPKLHPRRRAPPEFADASFGSVPMSLQQPTRTPTDSIHSLTHSEKVYRSV